MSRRARHDWILSGVRGGGRWGRKRRATGGSFPFHRRLRFEPLEDRRLLALVTVTTLNDTVDFNDGVTSLREAIFATNLVGGADTIEFAASLTSGGPATILLTQGELKITDALAINGPGANLLTIDASGNDPTPDVNNGDGSRIFNVDDGSLATFVDVSISGLTLTGGDLGGPLGGGAIFARENLSVSLSTVSGNSTNTRGGGVYSRFGNLTLTGSTISGNSALGGHGGGIYSRGTSLLPNTVTVTGSTISGNLASANGGGISGIFTNLSVTGSAISGNSASSEGGGIFGYRGNLTVTGGTISGNSAREGGGIHNLRGDIVVSGSTISNNAAEGFGGGVSSIAGNMTVTTSTISGNSASSGGGVSSSAGLTVTDSTISGNSATGNGGGIVINTGGVLTVTGGAISGNSAGGSGGGISNSGSATVAGGNISGNLATARGGGILNSGGIATLTSTTVHDNSARYGGGIYSSGTGSNVTLTSSQILDNSASRSGGGIHSRRDLTVTGTTISGNSAVIAGGGIASLGGNLAVTGSTVSGNSAGFGGGIAGGAAGNVVTVSSSTISGNSASDRAGGIFHGGGGNLTVSHSTITGNIAGNTSGGIGVYGAALLSHAIVAGNTRGAAATPSDVKGNVALAFSLLGVDTGATITDNGGNLIGTAAAPIDPLLGPLADNGGPTFTHAILAGSVAINRGDLSAVAGVGGVPEFDQRGTPFGRVFWGRIDIGAFEYQAASDLNLLVDTLTDESDGNYALGDLSLREAIALANTYPSADTIRFDPALTAAGPATILLTMGELTITDDTTIEGPGANLLTIDALQQSRIFNITATAGNYSFAGLTLTGGRTTGNNSNNLDRTHSGGAIRSLTSGQLTLDRSTVSGNNTVGDLALGGGIFAVANVRLTRSTVSGNGTEGANAYGGAIFTHGGVTLTESTISGNHTVGDFARGGGIYAADNVTLTQSTVTGNSTTGTSAHGGGINTRGVATLTKSTVGGNSTAGTRASGGGIIGDSGVILIQSTVSGNKTTGDFALGGGILANRNVTLTESTVSGNSTAGTGARGGGIYAGGNLTLTQSTVSGNSTAGSHADGGGILAFQGGVTLIQRSTVTDNHAQGAGALGGGLFSRSHLIEIRGSIVADNTAASGSPDLRDFFGSASLNYSLVGDNTGTGLAEAPVGSPDANGNLIGGPVHGVIDPLLGPLADNGGPTMAHALLAGSPAINRGDLSAVAGVGSVPEFDQRGTPFGRVFWGRIDIGAFEYQAASDLNLLVDTLADESDGNYSRGDLSLREAIALANFWSSTDTIRFDPALAGGTILLTQGELKITDDVSMEGLGAELLTIDASGNDPTPDINDGRGSRVFFVSDTNDSSLLEVLISGLTLTGGDVNDRGGAIFTQESLSVREVTISGNAAGTRGGGGIAAFISDPRTDPPGPGHLTVIDSTISGNIARGGRSAGGGIYAIMNRGGLTTVEGSTISENQSAFSGGGIAIVNRSSVGAQTITDSTISGNSAANGRGGAIYFVNLSSASENHLTVSGSTIANNSAQQAGGGISARLARGSLTLEDNTIADNRAISGESDGGGLYANLRNAPATITRNTIRNNSAGSGGGVWITSVNGAMLIDDSQIVDNIATSLREGSRGGGIYLAGDTVNATLRNSTVVGNKSLIWGGGVFVNAGDVSIIGSSIVGNMAMVSGGGIVVGKATMFTLTESSVHGNAAGFDGGGIANGVGVITISNSTISENSAERDGGGILNDSATLTITASTFAHNSASRDGGGLYNRASELSVSDTTFTDNEAGQDGGGLLSNARPVDLSGNTFSGNRAERNGGGMAAFVGPFAITNSTLSGNTAGALGGGVWTTTVTNLHHSTVVGNEAGVAGGGAFANYGPLSLDHTIVANNAAPAGRDLTGFLGATIEAHYSLIGSNAGTGLAAAPVGSPDANGNLIGGAIFGIIDPRLAPLADNGGPTQTHALLTGSPAINAGDPAAVAGVGDVPEFDQRGTPFGRVFGARIDIGAFEVQPIPLAAFGDFNQNGEVDAADYVVWRHSMINGVAPLSSAEGNGTMVQDDYDVWRAHFGQTLPAPAVASGAIALVDSVRGDPQPNPLPEGEGIAADPHPLDNSRVLAEGEGIADFGLRIEGEQTEIGGRKSFSIAGPLASRLFVPAPSSALDVVSRRAAGSRLPLQRALNTVQRDDALVAWLASRAADERRGGGGSFARSIDNKSANASPNAVDAVFERFSLDV